MRYIPYVYLIGWSKHNKWYCFSEETKAHWSQIRKGRKTGRPPWNKGKTYKHRKNRTEGITI